MANLGEKQKVEETEYESESEESVYAVATRRENASDDDDDGNGNSEGEARERLVRSDRKVRVGYGDEWDGLGGWDENDVDAVGELEVLGDEQLEVLKKLVEVEEEEEEKEDFAEKEVYAGEKQRKEKESKAPLDPRNGAFYMHDDRFRGRGRGSSRWTLDERFRALCEERKWKHDKFEQMKVQDSYDNNAFAEVLRISEQYLQGHSKNQGKCRGSVKANWSKTNDNINNQNYSANVVRGRGPIKYNPIMRSSNVNLLTIAKRSKKFVKGASNSVSVRASSKMKNVESCFLASEKHGFKENNCSALQMLNPSSPSKHLNSVTEKIDVKPGKAFEHFPTCALQNQDSFVPRCNSLVQGRIPNNPIGQDKFFSENFIHPASESYLTNLPPQPSIIWPTYTVASPQMMGPRDLFFSIMLSHQLSLPINQVSSVYPPAQQPIVQHIPIESMIRHPSLVYTQQLNQSSGSGAQASSEALLPNSYDIDKPGSLATTSKSKVALGGKGVSTCHGNGRGSFLSRVTQSNRNFTDNAALLPAMQLGSQQNGDHDEPAIKVAVTRYLSQSQNAFGNPEITWFPVFPAATGTVGSADSSLHAAAKGGYTAHSTGELSSYRVTRYSRMNINKQRE
ncbi:Btz domain-containing protein [Citrus sinensis]|nr:Btz domain-containing protein [Citrus sinensis]